MIIQHQRKCVYLQFSLKKRQNGGTLAHYMHGAFHARTTSTNNESQVPREKLKSPVWQKNDNTITPELKSVSSWRSVVDRSAMTSRHWNVQQRRHAQGPNLQNILRFIARLS